MTGPVVPRGLVNQWGRLIYDFMLPRATQEFSYHDIQATLHLPSGRVFNEAMGRARAFATQDGNCIAYCWFDRASGQCLLTCNPNDLQLTKSISYRGKSISGQTVNYVDVLEWGATNAQDPGLRRQCRQMARAYAGAALMEEAMGEMAEDLIVRLAES